MKVTSNCPVGVWKIYVEIIYLGHSSCLVRVETMC